jgi:hypothetical protein
VTASAAKDDRFVSGYDFINDPSSVDEAIWGIGNDCLWSKGESLVIAAPPGVGKTTLAVQLVECRIGASSGSVLGHQVAASEHPTLYLAMDRPRQIRRAMARQLGGLTPEQLSLLVVRKGPPEFDLGRRPETLIEMADKANAKTVFIDSLKDAVVGLSDDESGGNVNRAVQMCIVNDVDVVVLHHQRKKQAGSEKPKTLDDVYGSTWITSGAGSVILLWGAAGDAVVEFRHLKQPANEIGPMKIELDNRAGVWSVHEGFDLMAYVRGCGDMGTTASEAARGQWDKARPSGAETARTRRKLEALVTDGLATKGEPSLGGDGGTQGARYFAVQLTADDLL